MTLRGGAMREAREAQGVASRERRTMIRSRAKDERCSFVRSICIAYQCVRHVAYCA